jgi:hypothetical protein
MPIISPHLPGGLVTSDKKKDPKYDAILHEVARAMLDEFLNNPSFIHRLKEELKRID